MTWIGIATALFLYFFSLDSTDDYAGWIPATVATQIPAYLALGSAEPNRPLRRGSSSSSRSLHELVDCATDSAAMARDTA